MSLINQNSWQPSFAAPLRPWSGPVSPLNSIKMNLSAKTLLITAWACLLIAIILLNFSEAIGSRPQFILTAYYLVGILSLAGTIQSFRVKTNKLYKTLNIVTFILTVLIIYSMHIGFLGALK